MIDGVPAAVVLVPFEQRELDDPGELERVGPQQVFAPGDLEAQLAEQLRRVFGGTGRDEQQVVRARARPLERLAPRRFANRLDRARRRLAGPHPDQAAEADLLGLIDQRVELTPRRSVAARHRKAADHTTFGDDLFEHPELRIAEEVREVLDLEAEPQVRLVRSVPGDRFRVGNAAKRRADVPADFAADGLQHRLDHREHRLGTGKRHLEVELREFRLAIRPEILVAEAARDLEVAVHARDHQDLLEDLRRLRQRVELAGMDAARHKIVARAFGRRFREDRRLDFPESLRVEKLADAQRDAMAQPDVLLHARAPQVEVPVAEADLLGHGSLVRDRKWRRLRLGEHSDLAGEHFHLACCELRIDRVLGATLYDAGHTDDVLRPQPLRHGHQRLVVAHDDLRQAGAIADVDEGDAAKVAHAVHPPKQHRLAADIVGPKPAAGMGSGQTTELVGHRSGFCFSESRQGWRAAQSSVRPCADL